MMMEQKGNTTLFGCAILFILTSLLGLAISQKHLSYLRMGKEMRALICLKKQIQQTALYIERMEKINKAIEMSFKVEIVSLVIPGLAPLKAGGEKFRKMMKVLQQVLFVSEMKKKTFSLRKGCPLSKNLVKDAYKHQTLKLTRDYQGKAILRATQWKEKYYTKETLYSLNFSVVAGKLRFTSQRVKLR